MVILWIGFEFNALAKMVEPTSKAKFVEFITALRPDTMRGVRLPALDWPYVEGLRLDEAMHPHTILAVGLYGEVKRDITEPAIYAVIVTVLLGSRVVASVKERGGGPARSPARDRPARMRSPA